MVFAVDPEKSARWWAGVLDAQVQLDVAKDGSVYAWFDLHGIEYGFHPADDERNPRGGSPVVYWAVDNLTAERDRLLHPAPRPAPRRRGPPNLPDH
jgi:hypothetical protein